MIVLDTHVMLWMAANTADIGPATRRAIEQEWAQGAVGVSAISFWEVALLEERGRVSLPMPVKTWRQELLRAGLVEWPLDGAIALEAAEMVDFHRDPADRFITATAQVLGGTLISADESILDWPSRLSRLNARR